MKEYKRPSFEAVEFETTDIIQTSGTLNDGGPVGNFAESGTEVGWGTSTKSVDITE